MKKLLSLVLVAMLLVCAVPFQAAATEGTEPLKIEVYDSNGGHVTTKTYNVKPGDTVTLTEDFAKSLLTKDSWEFVQWTNKVGEDSLNAQISYSNLKKANADGNYYVNLILKKKAAEDTRVDAKVPVKIFVDGVHKRDGQITVPVDDGVKLTKELGLRLANPDEEFDKWVGTSRNNATDETVEYGKIYDGYSLELYVNTKKAEETPKYITTYIVDDKGNAISSDTDFEPVNGKYAVISDIMTYRWLKGWENSYEFVTAKSTEKGNKLTASTTINVGDTVTITVKAKSGSTPDDDTDTVRVTFFPAEGQAVATYKVTKGSTIDSKKVSDAQSKADNKTGYTFKGWKIDNKGELYTSAQVAKIAIKSDVEFYAQLEKSSSNTVNKAPWRVSLYIYKDTKVGSADKVIDISDGIAADGVVDMNDVANVVKKYYTAKTSDGIQYDGLYLAKGNFASDWANDKRYGDTISGIKEMRKEDPVNIIVMITNANVKNTTNEKADKTNPKTGDMIFIPVIFMVVSGAAIAGVYFYNKKRSAR